MNNDLNSVVKKWEWKSRRDFFGWGTSPEADWKVIFIGTVILVGLATTLNFLMFTEINNGGFFVVEGPTEETPVLDIEKLKATISYYEGRAVEFEKWKSGVNTVISDPSL